MLDFYEKNFVNFFNIDMLEKNMKKKNIFSQTHAFHKIYENFCEQVHSNETCKEKSIDLVHDYMKHALEELFDGNINATKNTSGTHQEEEETTNEETSFIIKFLKEKMSDNEFKEFISTKK